MIGVVVLDWAGGFLPPAQDGRLLLIACSAKKRRWRRPVPARQLYLGTLTRLALKLAEAYGLEPYILSAKYGIIHADTKVEYYEQKLAEPYAGPWPSQSGFYAGSDLYFGKAPKRFKRLIPEGLRIGEQAAHLKKLLREGLPK